MNPSSLQLIRVVPGAEPGAPAQSLIRDLLTTPAPTPGQIGILALFLLAVLGSVVTVEVVRRRREQLAKNRVRWESFTILARKQGLDEESIDRMRQMHLGLDALHSPDAMLRIPAVYDRALDAWISGRGGHLTAAEWESLDRVRQKLRFRGVSSETSLSHTRQIGEGQELRLASEDGQWTSQGLLRRNREEKMDIQVANLPPHGHARVRIAFSRQGDGEYKTVCAIAGLDPQAQEIHCTHTDQLVRQQLRMWVRVPVLIPGRMRKVIGPTGTPHQAQEFDVSLLDLSGGGAMVSSTQELEVESRGVLDFSLGEGYLEGVRFVMLRTGKTSRSGGHVCHLCFENIDVQTQERIMRYVFERQRSGRMTP